MTSLKRRTSLLWTVHPAPSKVILSLSSPFFSFLFCFLVLPHSVNKYLLSTCQVPGLAGKRNKTRKKTDEPLPSRSWHSVRACGTDRWALWEGNQGVLWSARGDSLPRFRNLGEGTSTMRPEDKGGLAIQRMGRSVQKEQHVQRQEMEWGRGGLPGARLCWGQESHGKSSGEPCTDFHRISLPVSCPAGDFLLTAPRVPCEVLMLVPKI